MLQLLIDWLIKHIESNNREDHFTYDDDLIILDNDIEYIDNDLL
jgi:hypothetical protein